jgi:hypothetical protein
VTSLSVLTTDQSAGPAHDGATHSPTNRIPSHPPARSLNLKLDIVASR